MAAFAKYPADSVDVTAEMLDSGGLFSRVDDVVVYLVLACGAALALASWDPTLQSNLQSMLALLLMVYHLKLSTSFWVRLFVGAAFGFALSVATIFVVVYKFSLALVPQHAQSAVKWLTVLASVCGLGCMQMFTEGVLQYARVMGNNTVHLAWMVWEYRYDPPPDHILALNGLITSIPVGPLFFFGFMAFGVTLIWSLGWFEAPMCQECGDRLIDLQCADCGRQFLTPRLCRACHRELDPASCHVDVKKVLRVGQRCLSLALLCAGVYLFLTPTYSWEQWLVALGVVAVSEAQLLRYTEHTVRLSVNRSPARPRMTPADYEYQTRMTTQRELQKLRAHLKSGDVGQSKLSETARAEVERFCWDDSYTLGPRASVRARRPWPWPSLNSVVTLAAVVALAVAFAPHLRPQHPEDRELISSNSGPAFHSMHPPPLAKIKGPLPRSEDDPNLFLSAPEPPNLPSTKPSRLFEDPGSASSSPLDGNSPNPEGLR